MRMRNDDQAREQKKINNRIAQRKHQKKLKHALIESVELKKYIAQLQDELRQLKLSNNILNGEPNWNNNQCHQCQNSGHAVVYCAQYTSSEMDGGQYHHYPQYPQYLTPSAAHFTMGQHTAYSFPTPCFATVDHLTSYPYPGEQPSYQASTLSALAEYQPPYSPPMLYSATKAPMSSYLSPLSSSVTVCHQQSYPPITPPSATIEHQHQSSLQMPTSTHNAFVPNYVGDGSSNPDPTHYKFTDVDAIHCDMFNGKMQYAWG